MPFKTDELLRLKPSLWGYPISNIRQVFDGKEGFAAFFDFERHPCQIKIVRTIEDGTILVHVHQYLNGGEALSGDDDIFLRMSRLYC